MKEEPDSKALYYDAGGISTLDIIQAKLTGEQYRGFILGNTIKYACRVNHKSDAVRDIEKLNVYAQLLATLK